ncbi:VOC family protein [Natronospirillum operosum]|uniref:VOC family protein n=1 Tax=Natronospirillum operosum TaxID=2759953 RepID=A0A4Z0W209_9GAMM|nr:VOC family protein [Natronospirillum operosum]TGG90266.1 VOC family protein [Natronospirillum operosum]
MSTVPFNMVTWYQIPADNSDRAWQFYGKVFGWSQEAAYADRKALGAINGEIAEREADLQSPRLVVRVADIEAVLAAVKDAGGEVIAAPVVIEEIDMAFATFRDTEGNVLNLVSLNRSS